MDIRHTCNCYLPHDTQEVILNHQGEIAVIENMWGQTYYRVTFPEETIKEQLEGKDSNELHPGFPGRTLYTFGNGIWLVLKGATCRLTTEPEEYLVLSVCSDAKERQDHDQLEKLYELELEDAKRWREHDLQIAREEELKAMGLPTTPKEKRQIDQLHLLEDDLSGIRTRY